METKRVLAIFILVMIMGFSFLATAGDLQPSAAPAPTMKTLNEIEPRTAISASDLPLTITEPGSYYLIEDVNFTDDVNNAITIECDDVTIDLTGYTIKGPDSGTTSGIYMSGRSGVEILNGTIRDFGNPAIREASSNGKSHRIINVRLISNGGGVFLDGYGHLVKDCTAAENSDRGISADFGCTLIGNTCYHNNNYGIETSAGSTVTGNTCYNNYGTNVHGISTGSGNTLAGNTCYMNQRNGINSGTGCTLTGNTCYDNGNHGIFANSGSTVTNNTTRNNGVNGINTLGNCLIDQNTAYNNTGTNLVPGAGSVTGVNCAPAP